MLEIVKLGQYPNFFNAFLNSLYSEYENTFFKNRTKVEIRRMYRKNMDNIYIAIRKSKFLGSYSIKSCLISDVYVVPTERSKGLGKILIQHAMKTYCWKWSLYTTLQNVSFYEQMGFHVKSKRKNIYYMEAYNFTMIWFVAALIIGLMTLFLF